MSSILPSFSFLCNFSPNESLFHSVCLHRTQTGPKPYQWAQIPSPPLWPHFYHSFNASLGPASYTTCSKTKKPCIHQPLGCLAGPVMLHSYYHSLQYLFWDVNLIFLNRLFLKGNKWNLYCFVFLIRSSTKYRFSRKIHGATDTISHLPLIDL